MRLMELTRFYLQLKEDPHGPNVALFVGNLPPNLNQKEYEKILLEYLDNGKISSIMLINKVSFFPQKTDSPQSGQSTTSMVQW